MGTQHNSPAIEKGPLPVSLEILFLWQRKLGWIFVLVGVDAHWKTKGPLVLDLGVPWER